MIEHFIVTKADSLSLQSWQFGEARGTSLSVGGDGRADSPGHSAKYGSYGLIDLDTNKVIHVQLVQVIKIHCMVLLMQ